MTKIALRDRLTRIVNAVFDGNVTAAATQARISPIGLHRVLHGKVTGPRLNTIQDYAESFGVPLAWLLGELSTTDAQPDGVDLPEPFWLILAFNRHRQERVREKLRSQRPATATARQIQNAFVLFDFFPLSPDFPDQRVTVLAKQLNPKNVADLAVIRRCAELESLLLETAEGVVQRLESEGRRGRSTQSEQSE
jgi:hypothetical protein